MKSTEECWIIVSNARLVPTAPGGFVLCINDTKLIKTTQTFTQSWFKTTMYSSKCKVISKQPWFLSFKKNYYGKQPQHLIRNNIPERSRNSFFWWKNWLSMSAELANGQNQNHLISIFKDPSLIIKQRNARLKNQGSKAQIQSRLNWSKTKV